MIDPQTGGVFLSITSISNMDMDQRTRLWWMILEYLFVPIRAIFWYVKNVYL